MLREYVAIRGYLFLAMVSGLVVGLSLWAGAVEKPKRSEHSTAPQVQGDHRATLSATLIDAEQKAKAQAASVEVKATGVQLIDPGAAHEQPKQGQGHLHYQVDNGPIIATTSPKLSFHELSPGQHKITVLLAGNDHQPLGPKETLTVNILPAPNGRAQR